MIQRNTEDENIYYCNEVDYCFSNIYTNHFGWLVQDTVKSAVKKILIVFALFCLLIFFTSLLDGILSVLVFVTGITLMILLNKKINKIHNSKNPVNRSNIPNLINGLGARIKTTNEGIVIYTDTALNSDLGLNVGVIESLIPWTKITKVELSESYIYTKEEIPLNYYEENFFKPCRDNIKGFDKYMINSDIFSNNERHEPGVFSLTFSNGYNFIIMLQIPLEWMFDGTFESLMGEIYDKCNLKVEMQNSISKNNQEYQYRLEFL